MLLIALRTRGYARRVASDGGVHEGENAGWPA